MLVQLTGLQGDIPVKCVNLKTLSMELNIIFACVCRKDSVITTHVRKQCAQSAPKKIALK